MTIYTVQIAPARGWRQIVVSEGGLRVDNGPLRPWTGVTSMRHAQSRTHVGTLILDLVVEFGADRETLSMNGSPVGAGSWKEMARKVCDRVIAARPETMVRLGHSPFGRAAVFVMGVVLLAAAVPMFAIAFDTGLEISDGEDLGFLGFGIVVAVGGGAFVLSNPPWRAPPRIPVTELRARLGPAGDDPA